MPRRSTIAAQRQHDHEVRLYAARLRHDHPDSVRARAKARRTLRADLDAARKDSVKA